MRGAGERLTRACDTLPARAPWSAPIPRDPTIEQIGIELGRDLRDALCHWAVVDVRRGVHPGCTRALHGGIGDVLRAMDLLDLGHRGTGACVPGHVRRTHGKHVEFRAHLPSRARSPYPVLRRPIRCRL